MAGICFKRPIELIALLFSADLEVSRQTIFTTFPLMVFGYDRYGNRRFDEANTTMPASFTNQALTDPAFDASNNRMAAGQGWSYDAAGNTIGDPEGRTFFYDAENKQVEVRNASSTTVGQYFYDGDGKRVKKYVPSTGETTVFAYDAAGKLIAEYSTVVASPQDAKTRIPCRSELSISHAKEGFCDSRRREIDRSYCRSDLSGRPLARAIGGQSVPHRSGARGI